LVLLMAYGGSIGSGRDGRAHALSVSAIGFKGLVDLTRNFHAIHMIEAPEDLEDEALVVVAIEPQSRPGDLARLLQQRQGRPTLIILPKWRTVPQPGRPGWVRGVAPVAGAEAPRLLGRKINVRVAADPPADARMAAGAEILDGLSVPIPAAPQVIEGGDIIPLLSLPGGGALVASLGDQPHYVVADPDLLNNHGLHDPATARAAIALIDRLNTTSTNRVGFDLTVNALGARSRPSLLRTAFEPPFLVMTIALIVAALLAGLHGAVRFGQALAEKRAIPLGKAALVENSAGLIRLARREARLGGAYADLIRGEAARLTAVPAFVQGAKLDAYLDRLSRSDRPNYSALAARLGAARDRHELVAAARALFSWKKDIIR
jgi:hypothetical protein